MLHYKNMEDAQEVFKALGNETRLHILNILYQQENVNLNEIARQLGLANSAVTMHIGKLQEAGLIEVHTTSGKRGSMKLCVPKYDTLMVDLAPPKKQTPYYHDEIKIGHYAGCRIQPTCGLTTREGLIGEMDDPRYFTFPQRFDACMLWFAKGYVEYQLPNHLKAGQRPTELRVSMELSSEAPGYCEVYPSDLYFSLNGRELGCWISPGDFGEKRGRLNPEWWGINLNQHGLLKTLVVNEKGTFIDGSIRISKVAIGDLDIDYRSELLLRLSAPEDTRNAGGMTIYGRGFGDYDQDIRVLMGYTSEG